MSENDWIEWKGGECPVEEGTLVEVNNRGGLYGEGVAGSFAYWQWIGSDGDIIAYRLHKPESDIADRTHMLGVNGNTTATTDLINNPPHYKQGDIECIDAIKAALTEEEFRGYCKGNAIKYSWRERYKGGDESIKKAIWYLDCLTK